MYDYYQRMMPNANANMPVKSTMSSQPMFTYEPYVFQTLQSVIGKNLVIETVKDTLRGMLMDVKPDHIVMSVGDETFFVRTCQIVTIMPD